jgi:hypothetical protein
MQQKKMQKKIMRVLNIHPLRERRKRKRSGKKMARNCSPSEQIELLYDFEACKQKMVDLLCQARKKTIYYSTFLCDFTQVLSSSSNSSFETKTLLNCFEQAIERGVDISILYNPIGDYGTEKIEIFQQMLPNKIQLICMESKLGPKNWFSSQVLTLSRTKAYILYVFLF